MSMAQSLRRTPWPWWVALTVVVFLFALWMPPTSDDWRRIAFADKSMAALTREAVTSYLNHNGRIVGNTISFVLIDPPWLRAATKALTVLGLVVALRRATRLTSLWATLACFAGVFLLPGGVLRESYGWSAGFFNYVPPLIGVVLLVASVAGRWPRRDGWGSAVGCGVLSAVTCLFVEHVTVAVLGLSVGAVLLAWVQRRRPTHALAGWALGAIVGTVVMFASPGLREVATHEDAYFSYPATASGAWAKMIANYATVTANFLFSVPVLVALLVAVSLGLGFGVGTPRDTSAPRRAARRGDAVAVVGGLTIGAYALVSRLFAGDRLVCPEAAVDTCATRFLALDLAALLVALGLVVWLGMRHVHDPGDRAAWLGFLAVTLLMLGPLLVVSPIGPRNLVGPIITLTGLLVLAARPLLDAVREPRPVVAAAFRVLVLGTCLVGIAVIGAIEFANGAVSAEREALMQRAVADGTTSVGLPAFPHPSWVHAPNDTKITNRYYRETPGDIEVTFP